MATIISEKHNIPATALTVSDYLSKAANYRILFPADRIENWMDGDNHFSFSLKGLATIGMAIQQIEPAKCIHLSSHGKNPFDFTLRIDIKSIGENSELEITFDGQMNFMIEAMASKPLRNLFNTMSENLRDYFAAGR